MHEHHQGMLPVVDSVDVDKRTDVHKLHGGAVGLAGVLFLTVTGSAPITAMLLNTPISVGYGNGLVYAGGLHLRHHHPDHLLGRVYRHGAQGDGGGRLLQLHQPRSRARARDGHRPCDHPCILGVRGVALRRLRVLREREAGPVRLPLLMGLVRPLHGRADLGAVVLRHPHLGPHPRRRARHRGADSARLRRGRVQLERCERHRIGDQPVQRVPQPAREWSRSDGRPRRHRRRRRLLRLLVVGRLRDGAELRRGVEEPQEDRADGHVHLGDRARHLLHGHLVGLDLGLRQPGRGRVRRAEQLLRLLPDPGRAVREPVHLRPDELPDPDRVVRLRHGLPPDDGALHVLAGTRARAAAGSGSHPSQVPLAARRVAHPDGDRAAIVLAFGFGEGTGDPRHQRLHLPVRPHGRHGRGRDPLRPGAGLGRDHQLLPHAPRGASTTGGRPPSPR